jgi:hypothetical protein
MRTIQRFLPRIGLFVGICALPGCGPGSWLASDPGADLIFLNGGIYTVNPRQPWAEAAAVQDGRIVAVGTNAEISKRRSPGTRVVDLSDRMALPGFHDAHVHPMSAGFSMLGCSLIDLHSVQEALDTVRDCAARTPGEWITVWDFDLGLFPSGNPQKSLLDQVVPDRPVYATAADGHTAWTNSEALRRAGITAATADPPKGKIERDPLTREPSGALRETAMDLVAVLLPDPSFAEEVEALATAIREMNRFGITSFIDASVTADTRQFYQSTWDAYQRLDQSGRLTARVVMSLTYGTFTGHPGSEFDPVLARRAEYASARLHTDAIKIFVDGVLEGESAALVEPYTGMGTHAGGLNLEPAELADAVARFDAMNLQVHMHAIGDRAVRVGLDAFAEARRRNGSRDNRHHIAHLQLIHPDDLPRFAALDVTANFQALWAFPDAYITELNLPVVGPERVNRMYPIASVQRAGGRIVGGSDWSVSSVNPLEAIETAITRQDVTGRLPGVLNASEAVDLPTMIAAYTLQGAWLMHQDAEVGSIETGKRADIVVLDRDLFGIPAAEIGNARVLLTLLDGREIFAAEGR